MPDILNDNNKLEDERFFCHDKSLQVYCWTGKKPGTGMHLTFAPQKERERDMVL